eukprot:GDKI01008461.1.p3 GENE.GDKI01008461.1~~GDKI01008461.1.p3  ORF type:complete len:113 (+),score=50.39 GDKI01008461.1:170-508(+)
MEGDMVDDGDMEMFAEGDAVEQEKPAPTQARAHAPTQSIDIFAAFSFKKNAPQKPSVEQETPVGDMEEERDLIDGDMETKETHEKIEDETQMEGGEGKCEGEGGDMDETQMN